MLQIARRDFYVYMKNRLMSQSQDFITSAQNLKVNGPWKIDLDTGIIVGNLVTFMMATGSLKMKKNPECGTTLLETILQESGKMTKVMQMVHGLQILSIHLSDTLCLKT